MIFKKIRYFIKFIKYLLAEYKKEMALRSLRSKFKNCYIAPSSILNFDYFEDVKIKQDVYIGAFTVIDVINNDKSLRNSAIEIGEGTYIGEQNNIRASGGYIKIGRKCLISQQISIIAANHSINKGSFIAYQPWSLHKNYVEIGDDVWIGCGSQILPGVKIGSGSIIAAGSLINKDIPENAIVAGVPAKILKYRT